MSRFLAAWRSSLLHGLMQGPRRVSDLWLGVAVLASLGLVLVMLHMRQIWRAQSLQLQDQVRSLQQQEMQLGRQRLRRQQVDRLWLQLQNAGLGRQEMRLQWLELLQAQQRPQLQLEGRLQAQRDFELQAEGGQPVVDVRASRLELQLRARHEEYWLAVLGRLQTAGFMLLPRRCRAERVAGSLPLQVDCDFDVLSLRTRSSGGRPAPGRGQS